MKKEASWYLTLKFNYFKVKILFDLNVEVK